ncbi:hypothetical protein N0V88_006014 [Collariella sp. IMI 366227]|nr:hypothetical protein N0V88_006014 [Collariella sp. IMI 366227]
MAIQNSPPSNLVVMDANYLSRVIFRRQLLSKHTSAVHGILPAGHAAVLELYTYLLGTYLPARYPTMFELLTGNNGATVLFHNKITNHTSTISPPLSSPLDMLRILAETIEDDMFLLLRDDTKDGPATGEHRAVAFVCCHPAGFAPAKKLGKTLAEIHEPVPAYERIGASMEKYFGRLEMGKGPRFALAPGYEHKAFIPFSAVFSSSPDPSRHSIARARAISLHPHHLILDREWQGSRNVFFDYLVVATGTRLAAPGTMPSDDKLSSVDYLQSYQREIQIASSIAIIGGGAVGVQMACDLKELYPSKTVTLIHSREHLMPAFHPGLSNLIKSRFTELGINLVTNNRVLIPADGFPKPSDSSTPAPFSIHLQPTTSSTNPQTLSTDFAILATGQTPNTAFLQTLALYQPLSPSSPSEAPSSDQTNGDTILTSRGFIPVFPTTQFASPLYPHIFAVGDAADSGAHKAARPGAAQAGIAARNIAALIARNTRNVIFRNPNVAEGETEPVVKLKDE